MRIGELAARAGVQPRTVRFYESRGILPAPPRTSVGYRRYDETALTRLRFVKAAQALGLSLAEITDVLRIRDMEGAPCSYVVELLTEHIRTLDERIRELSALRDELAARLPDGAPDPGRCDSETVCYLIEERRPD